jgi:hypothetical protein
MGDLSLISESLSLIFEKKIKETQKEKEKKEVFFLLSFNSSCGLKLRTTFIQT